MTNTCRTCKNWTNWKKTTGAISDPLSTTPSWDAKTAVLGRCVLTNKLVRGDMAVCEQYNGSEPVEMHAVVH